MAGILDQAIVTMSGILMLINIKICSDLVITLWKKYELDIVWLTVMFASFIMVGIGGILTVNLLSVSLWLRVGMLITLTSATVGTYNTLQGLNK